MKVVQLSPYGAEVTEILALSDKYMASLYPAESNHLDYADDLARTNVFLVGAFKKETLTGIGAVKILTDDGLYGELKRVYIKQEHRGNGASRHIMFALENHLMLNNVNIARLETGTRQPEAIGLYNKLGYRERTPFGQYKIDPYSIFMEKTLLL